MKNIPYGRQNITEEDIRQVTETLRADYITTGPRVSEFENKFSRYVQSDYALAVSNGTAALHLAALALKDHPGKKVITSPITFVASANCILYSGKEVDFVDIDPDSFLLDLNQLEDKLRKSPAGTYAGIIPVDMAGYPVNTEDLRFLADKYNIWIIEDACHAPGGSFINSRNEEVFCGSGRYEDLAIFSFHPVKHITTGEGGMITTNNKELFDTIKNLRSHGITKEPEILSENHGGWYYEMQQLGFNYRLTDFQAALGNSQLERLDENIKRRREIASIYDAELAGIHELKTPSVKVGYNHAYHLYIIRTKSRKMLYDHLVGNSILAQIHYIPVHTQPYYKNIGWQKGDFPIAENYYEECISLPIYHSLSDEDQSYVIEKVSDFFKH